MTDLAGTQISNLLETLPGIAQVLRSPVADAFVGLIRAATGHAEFRMADAEEVMRYAVRRNLIPEAESELVLEEATDPKPVPRRPAKPEPAARPARKAAAPAKAGKARPAPKKAKPKVKARPKARVKAKAKPKPKPKSKAKAKAKTKPKPKASTRKPSTRKPVRKPPARKK